MSTDSVPWICKPDAAIGVHNDVVWGVEWFALKLFRKDGDAAVFLVARDPAGPMLTGELAALEGLS